MGRARRNRIQRSSGRSTEKSAGSTTGRDTERNAGSTEGKPIDDCFSLYILFRKLHNLFVE